jgi:WS/DGAT/MGAT family acyltransferase
MCVIWAFVEYTIYVNRMSRQARMGLGDPVVRNRFLLWMIWTGAIVREGCPDATCLRHDMTWVMRIRVRIADTFIRPLLPGQGGSMPSGRLSGLDAAFFSAETPGNHLHLMAVMVLDPQTVPGGYSFERMQRFIADHLALVPPLRRRIVEVPFGIDRPRWVEQADLDIDYHVRRAAVPTPGSEVEVSRMLAELNDFVFDRAKPLWRMLLVEGLADGRIAILAKLHHSMMDGIVGMQYMAALISPDPEGVALPEDLEVEAGDGVPSNLQLLAEALPTVLLRPLRLARLAGGLVFSTLAGLLERGGSDAPEPSTVPHTMFNRRSSPEREYAYCSLSMAEVRDVASKADATLNDVVLALTSAALRRYLEARDAMPEESLVAGIPVSLHDDDDELANAYSVLMPRLATHVDDPAERLTLIRDETRELKQAQSESGGFGDMLDAVEVPPPWFYNIAARLYTGLHVVERMERPFFNVLVSSVPGPPTPLYFGGARILGMHPFGPVYDGMLLNITVIGREDSLDLGLVACRHGVPEARTIADGLPVALEELRRAMGIE